MFRALLAVGVGLAALTPSAAHATWSMVAVDPDTREVGAVGATCGPFVWMIGRVEPDAGAMVSLCGTNMGARKDVTEILAGGGTPEEALAEVTAAAYDDDLGIRQYAIVGFEGPGAVYTGDECDEWKGTHAEEHMAAAGNILVDQAVLDEAVAAFHDSEGEALADRLMAALVAGAEQGGDSRCDPGVAAESAFVFVAGPDDDRPTIDLTASDKDGAVWALVDKYDGGKLRNCHCAATGRAGGAASVLGLLTMLGLAGWRRRSGHGSDGAGWWRRTGHDSDGAG